MKNLEKEKIIETEINQSSEDYKPGTRPPAAIYLDLVAALKKVTGKENLLTFEF